LHSLLLRATLSWRAWSKRLRWVDSGCFSWGALSADWCATKGEKHRAARFSGGGAGFVWTSAGWVVDWYGHPRTQGGTSVGIDLFYSNAIAPPSAGRRAFPGGPQQNTPILGFFYCD
jgi:hypothetical protein